MLKVGKKGAYWGEEGWGRIATKRILPSILIERPTFLSTISPSNQ